MSCEASARSPPRAPRTSREAVASTASHWAVASACPSRSTYMVREVSRCTPFGTSLHTCMLRDSWSPWRAEAAYRTRVAALPGPRSRRSGGARRGPPRPPGGAAPGPRSPRHAVGHADKPETTHAKERRGTEIPKGLSETPQVQNRPRPVPPNT